MQAIYKISTYDAIRHSALCIALAALSFPLINCGGGGGGSDDTNESTDIPARTSVAVSPGSIDRGDRTTVKVTVEEINEDGIAVKIRFPLALTYIVGSSELTANGETRDSAPTNNESDTNYRYLVFYLNPAQIGGNQAIVTFKLTGTAFVADGLVEVDSDLDNPQINNQDEFDVSSPNFDAEDEDYVIVSGAPTATPTP